MKFRNLALLIICFLAIHVSSCVKDAPIYPGDPDFVPYTGTKGGGNNGGGGSTGTVDETKITGKWQVSKMYTETYKDGAVQFSMEAFINLYTGVELNSSGNTYQFEGSFDAPFPGTYILSKQGSTVYIQLEEDPFNRSDNDKIRITNLTDNSMTWVAIDPASTDTALGKIQAGWKVVYTRVP